MPIHTTQFLTPGVLFGALVACSNESKPIEAPSSDKNAAVVGHTVSEPLSLSDNSNNWSQNR